MARQDQISVILVFLVELAAFSEDFSAAGIAPVMLQGKLSAGHTPGNVLHPPLAAWLKEAEALSWRETQTLKGLKSIFVRHFEPMLG